MHLRYRKLSNIVISDKEGISIKAIRREEAIGDYDRRPVGGHFKHKL